jgi:hypothetical protein
MDFIILMISYFLTKKLNLSLKQVKNILPVKEEKITGLDIFEISAYN